MRLLFTSTDTGVGQVGSRLIRAFEGGLASHCGAQLAGGVVDASWPAGVRLRPSDEFLKGRNLVAVVDVPLPDEAAAARWLLGHAERGTRYDWRGILSFLAWRDIGSKRRYECSGLLLRALLEGGLVLNERPDRFGVRHLLLLTGGRG